jgi:hypothetical protein
MSVLTAETVTLLNGKLRLETTDAFVSEKKAKPESVKLENAN